MNIPIELIEELEAALPPTDQVEESYIRKYFTYEGMNYAIYFYKVRDVGAEFWMCNPLNIVEVIG